MKYKSYYKKTVKIRQQTGGYFARVTICVTHWDRHNYYFKMEFISLIRGIGFKYMYQVGICIENLLIFLHGIQRKRVIALYASDGDQAAVFTQYITYYILCFQLVQMH